MKFKWFYGGKRFEWSKCRKGWVISSSHCWGQDQITETTGLKNTNHRVELLLQMVAPGLLRRHDAITKRLFAPPKNLLGDQVQAFEGVSQKVLLHPALQQDIENISVSTLQDCAEYFAWQNKQQLVSAALSRRGEDTSRPEDPWSPRGGRGSTL